MITSLLLCVPAIAGNPTVTWEAPSYFVEGTPFQVTVEIAIPDDGAPLANWLLTPAAFTLNGKPVAERKGREVIQIAAGTKLSLAFDLAPAIKQSKSYKGSNFQLAFAKEYLDSPAVEVKVALSAPKGLDFMEVPEAELSKYKVIMSTNRGEMILEFWPEIAPMHVRNYLDLCYTGFYDGLTFHRVIPGFMIQGGDPTGSGSGNGPRTLKAEFNNTEKYKHVPGVLSMARSQSPDSASCQFFVMHKNAPHLDNSYSAFGKVVEGLDVVEQIVSTPRDARDKPQTTQFIKRAVVIQVQ